MIAKGAPWPCSVANASAVTLKQPAGGLPERPQGPFGHKPNDVYRSSATLEHFQFQDLIDVLPDVVKAAAGVPLRFQLSVTLGDGQVVDKKTVEAINKLLEEVSPGLRLPFDN